MKHLYTYLILIFASTTLFGQNTATFKVDMSEYSESFTQVNLNGEFNGWCGGCANMLDDDGDNIWELTVGDLPDGNIEYKFTTDGWTTQETFTPGAPCTNTTGEFTNRLLTLAGDTTLAVVCWENCTECGGAPVSADITFRVDMNDYTGSFTTVNLNGTFNGWCGGCAPMTDGDADGIYEITTNLLVGGHDYKFTIDGWDGEEILTEGESCTTTVDEFTNRFIDVSEETILPAVCWESCNECGVGIENINFQSYFSISPNPSQGEFNIAVSNAVNSPVQISVYNLLGEPLTETNKTIFGNTSINLSEAPAGIYFVKFDDGLNATYKRISKIR